jgi:hypothetical protein
MQIKRWKIIVFLLVIFLLFVGILAAVYIFRRSIAPKSISEPQLVSTNTPDSIQPAGEVTNVLVPDQSEDTDSAPAVLNHPTCLQEGETAKWVKVNEKSSDGIFKVIISDDKNSPKGEVTLDVWRTHRDPIELRSCGMYAIRRLNYDSTKTKQGPGYRVELWKYQYDGSGKKILLLQEVKQDGKFILYYNADFRVSPEEKYIALEKGYTGQEGHGLIIMNPDNLKDIFYYDVHALSASGIVRPFGGLNLLSWSPDSKYFWASVSDGPEVSAYLRVDLQSEEPLVLTPPSGTGNGNALNTSLGLVTTGEMAWTGVAEETKKLSDQWREEGKKSKVWVYDLYNKKIVTELGESDDPTWWGQPQWISTSQLQYILPDGTKKVWIVPEKYLKRLKE